MIRKATSGSLEFEDAQRLVDGIWMDLGLHFPPRVAPMPRQARRRLADASRLCLRLPASVPYWVFLHEVAHALSCTEDGNSDGHGPVFVGLYVQLLVRYLRMSFTDLVESLNSSGIKADLDARPVFLDAAPTPQ